MNQKNLYEQAVEDYDLGKLDSAVAKFLAAAEGGNVNAMETLAVLYGDGDGVDYDFDRSVYWDMRSIESGSLTSLSNLAITYRTHGDIREAKKWFEKAVESGDGDAALDLAKLYMVSDKETETLITLLQKVVESDNVCAASVDEAKEFLKEFGHPGYL